MHYAQEAGWQSGVRSFIIPGLHTNIVQKLNVGTVYRQLHANNVYCRPTMAAVGTGKRVDGLKQNGGKKGMGSCVAFNSLCHIVK